MCDTICGSFLHTFVEKQIFRELFLSTLSSQMCPVSSLARVRSETRRRRDFSQELSIKILKFKIRCVAFSGPSTLFYPRAYTNGGGLGSNPPLELDILQNIYYLRKGN